MIVLKLQIWDFFLKIFYENLFLAQRCVGVIVVTLDQSTFFELLKNIRFFFYEIIQLFLHLFLILFGFFFILFLNSG